MLACKILQPELAEMSSQNSNPHYYNSKNFPKDRILGKLLLKFGIETEILLLECSTYLISCCFQKENEACSLKKNLIAA